MSRSSKYQKIIDASMQGFRNFYYGNMKTNINNVLVLKKCGIKAGKNVTNPIIRFTFDRAMTHVLERSLLEIVSAYELVNKELIRHGIRRLGFANQDYKDLKIMRNKLLAHKIENSLKTERYKKWYSKKYGDYEKTFDLILRVSERIVKKIEYLELKGFINPHVVITQVKPEIQESDVENFIEALKNHNIY